MYSGKLVFGQVMDHLPWHRFRRCVERYGGNHRIKSFSCSDQYRCMAFAQLTYRSSPRDVEVCLRAQSSRLYHMGIRGGVARNTLANANSTRDWRIHADFAQHLIHKARHLSDDSHGLDLESTVYALDSSTIDLCLSLFPWARFRRTKGAVKPEIPTSEIPVRFPADRGRRRRIRAESGRAGAAVGGPAGKSGCVAGLPLGGSVGRSGAPGRPAPRRRPSGRSGDGQGRRRVPVGQGGVKGPPVGDREVQEV